MAERSDNPINDPVASGVGAPADPEDGRLKDRLDNLEQRLHEVALLVSPTEGRAHSGPSSSARQPNTTSIRRRVIDVGAVVAVVALIFSFNSFLVDQRRQDREDRRDARGQLAELTRRINALPRDEASLRAQLGAPALGTDLSSSLATETTILIRQIEQIERDHRDVFQAVDYYALGWAHMYQYDAVSAREAYEKAEQLASQLGSDVEILVARRGLAGALFLAQDYEAGRRVFSDALKLSEALGDPTSPLRESQVAYTRVAWALIEAQSNHCAQARAQLDVFTSARHRTSRPWVYDLLRPITEQVTSGCEQLPMR